MESLIVSGVAWRLTTLVSAFAGSYLGSYLKKKGGNLATHEDIDKLVDQVRAVTTTTKEIEAKISDDVWRRQRHWELKREVLFSTAKTLTEAKDTLNFLAATVQTKTKAEKPDEVNPIFYDAAKRWLAASTQFEETTLLLGIVCGKELADACDEFDIHESDRNENGGR